MIHRISKPEREQPNKGKFFAPGRQTKSKISLIAPKQQAKQKLANVVSIKPLEILFMRAYFRSKSNKVIAG